MIPMVPEKLFLGKLYDFRKYDSETQFGVIYRETKSGKYFPTSVEGVTAFLNDEPEFKEEHTALSDVYWELRILIECAKRGQNILEYVSRGGWIALDGSIIEYEERA